MNTTESLRQRPGPNEEAVMTRTRVDWKGVGAVLAGGAFAVALYVAALAVLFGPMAHAVLRIS